jgi:hypothetical protein
MMMHDDTILFCVHRESPLNEPVVYERMRPPSCPRIYSVNARHVASPREQDLRLCIGNFHPTSKRICPVIGCASFLDPLFLVPDGCRRSRRSITTCHLLLRKYNSISFSTCIRISTG